MRACRVWNARVRTYQIAWHSRRKFADSGRKLRAFLLSGLLVSSIMGVLLAIVFLHGRRDGTSGIRVAGKSSL